MRPSEEFVQPNDDPFDMASDRLQITAAARDFQKGEFGIDARDLDQLAEFLVHHDRSVSEVVRARFFRRKTIY